MEGIEEELAAQALPTTDGTGHDDVPSAPRTDTVTTTSDSPPADTAPKTPEQRAKKESGSSIEDRAKDSTSQDNEVGVVLRKCFTLFSSCSRSVSCIYKYKKMLATLEYLEQEVGFTRMDNLSLQKEIEWLQTQNLDLKNRLRAVASDIKQVRTLLVCTERQGWQGGLKRIEIKPAMSYLRPFSLILHNIHNSEVAAPGRRTTR